MNESPKKNPFATKSSWLTPTTWQLGSMEQIITVRVPADTRWEPKLAQQLMVGLYALPGSFTLRIRATRRQIAWQVVLPAGSVPAATKALYALYPHAKIEVANMPALGMAALHHRYQMGAPFVAPLKYAEDLVAIDPLAGIVGAMANLNGKEVIIYELALEPARQELYELGKQLTTTSRISAWDFLTPDGALHALWLRSRNWHRQPRYAAALQRLVESKLHVPLKEGNLLLRIEGAPSKRAENMASLFQPPLAAFAREGLNYLTPADDQSFPLILSAPETAALWHPPTEDCQVAGIQWAPRHSSPLPQTMDVHQKGIVLGNNVYQGRKNRVVLPYADRVTHVMLVGKTRTGKSSLLYNMVRQDIAAGKGVGVIDPHGDLARLILTTGIPQEREKDVVFFDTTDRTHAIGFNPLSAPPGVPRQVMAGLTVAVIRKIFADQWSPTRMEDALYAALMALLTLPSATIQDVPRIFSDKAFRWAVLAQVTDPVALEFWKGDFELATEGFQREIARPINNRLRRFYRAEKMRRIICQPGSLDFRPILDNRKIFIADLSGLSEIESETLGALLISKIQMAAMSRSNIPLERRVPFYFYIDEVQDFVTTSLDKLFSEAGKYGISLIVANQFLKQLSGSTLDAVLGNVGTTIMFRLGPQDGHALAPFVQPRFSLEGLLSLDRFHTIVSMQHGGQSVPAFSMETLPPRQPGFDAYERLDRIRHRSQQLYAQTNADIDANIAARYQTNPADKSQLDRDEEGSYFD